MGRIFAAVYDPVLERSEDALEVAGGRDCNRPTADLIAGAGFTVAEVRIEPFRKAHPVLQPLVVGVAAP